MIVRASQHRWGTCHQSQLDQIYVCLCGVFLTVCRGGADGTDTRLGRNSFALLLFEAR